MLFHELHLTYSGDGIHPTEMIELKKNEICRIAFSTGTALYSHNKKLFPAG